MAELLANEMINLESLEGKLLVATPSLEGTCFAKALIYICAHDEKGAIGVIINHSLGTLDLKDHIESANIKYTFRNKKIPIMFGGPIEQEKVIILSLTKEQEQNFNQSQTITIYTEGDKFLSNYFATKTKDKFLIVKGFAAWDADQLEEEINENVWLIAPASLEILFSHNIKNKWQRVIESIGVKDLSYLTNYSGHA